MVEFVITPRIRDSIKLVISFKHLSPPKISHFNNYLQAHTIPLAVLCEISELLRKSKGPGKGNESPKYVHELIIGSELYLPPLKKEESSLSEDKRKKLQANLDNIRYKKMTSNVSFTSQISDAKDRLELRNFNAQLGIGINIIISMVVAFLAGWFVGSRSFGTDLGGLIVALICMIGIMLVETWLFIIRAERINKNEIDEKLKTKKESLNPQIFGPGQKITTSGQIPIEELSIEKIEKIEKIEDTPKITKRKKKR